MTQYPLPQSPLILRLHRLMDAFAKSNDERDFYLDRAEGSIIFVDLDKDSEDLEKLELELEKHKQRYCLLPKLSFYETKKIMEGFVNEKVYDIDTKEKLLDIISSRDAREQFLEFIYENETELEKWQLFYQERARVRIIEWLRNNQFKFVFEEDLDLPRSTIEQLKLHLFEPKVAKDITSARALLSKKAETYYSNEALNPRPKRGRPPKQVAKIEVETQVSQDIYTQVSPIIRRFLHLPEIVSPSSITFSEKFDTEEELMAHLRGMGKTDAENQLQALSEKFASLKKLSTQLGLASEFALSSFGDDDDDDDDDDEEEEVIKASKPKAKKAPPKTTPKKGSASPKSKK